jgi:hypothetical protein
VAEATPPAGKRVLEGDNVLLQTSTAPGSVKRTVSVLQSQLKAESLWTDVGACWAAHSFPTSPAQASLGTEVGMGLCGLQQSGSRKVTQHIQLRWG